MGRGSSTVRVALYLDPLRTVSPGACSAARSFIVCPENPPADLPDAPAFRSPVKRAWQSGVWSARPASARGADASSRTRGGMRWTWRCRQTSDIAADDEVVWSWRAHAGVKFSRRHAPFEDDGGNKLVHRGEREVSRKPLRREGRSESACTCGQRAHAQDFPARGPWVQRAPGLPCALGYVRGCRAWHHSDEFRRENAEDCSVV
jgi:hypothetical protein